MTKQKGSIILIILPVLILVGAGLFVVYRKIRSLPTGTTLMQNSPYAVVPAGAITPSIPTTSPATNQTPESDIINWKTYRNEKYGFEIKYDPESSPIERDGGGETVGQFTFLQTISFGRVPLKSPHGFEVEINQKFSVSDYQTDIVGHIASKIDSVEKTQVNGNSWTKLNYQIFLTTHYIPITKAVINNDKYGYAITASALDIDQILDTFRFLDQIKITNIGNWKTCTDSVFNFSVNYPSDWDLQIGQLTDEGDTNNIPKTNISFSEKAGTAHVSIIGNFQAGWCEGGGCKKEVYTTNSGLTGGKFSHLTGAYYFFDLDTKEPYIHKLFINTTYGDQKETVDKIVNSLVKKLN